MKRRSFLYLLGASVYGVGVGFFSSRMTQSPWVDPTYFERILLDFYSPEFDSIHHLYSNLDGFSSAYAILVERGVLIDAQFSIDQYNNLLALDRLVDYRGWLYAEVELQLYMAAYLYVSERLCHGACA